MTQPGSTPPPTLPSVQRTQEGEPGGAGRHLVAETDRRWMRRALRLARRAEAAGEVPVSALVVRDGRLLAAAANAPITRHDPSAHAEMLALRRAARRVGNYRLPGAELYVTLEPCIMCAGAIVQARIRRVIYAASDPRAGAGGSVFNLLDNVKLNHRAEVTGGIEADAAGQLLQTFFRHRRGRADTHKRSVADMRRMTDCHF